MCLTDLTSIVLSLGGFEHINTMGSWYDKHLGHQVVASAVEAAETQSKPRDCTRSNTPWPPTALAPKKATPSRGSLAVTAA